MLPRSRRLVAATAVLAPLAWGSALAPGHAAGPTVLLVGTYNGVTGPYTSIQAAVNAAASGDWVLVAPGVYHETGSNNPARAAGVLITKPSIHLRGMDRNTVIVDGTNPTVCVSPNCPPPPCPSDPALQNFGPADPTNSNLPAGRNGIEVYGKGFTADSVSIENLTVCNFLSSDGGGNGNEIWWNGGDGSGIVGMNGLSGAYLTTTSTYYKDDNSAQAKYGIFTSNVRGPGTIAHTFASNMGDSDYYIGACPDCNLDLTDAHAFNSSLGFSGTNGGGHLIVENSEWAFNKDGILPNTLNNDDAPSPQNGACPSGTGPTGTFSCTVIRNNLVHDNNNPNTPQSGIAGSVPVGVGIEISGGQNDVVTGNTVTNQKSWGILINDFPDTSTPPAVANCAGGIQTPGLCYFVAFGNEISGNTLSNNGGFGNPTNGDLADDHQAHNPGNCWHDNTDNGGTPSSDPPSIQTLMGAPCFVPPSSPNSGEQLVLTAELACATGLFGQCPQPPAGTPAYPGYPARDLTKVQGQMLTYAAPMNGAMQPTMPEPCAGAPANAFCAGAAVAPEVPRAFLPVLVGVAMVAAAWLVGKRRALRRRGAR